MPADRYADVKVRLEQKREELTSRLKRITENVRRGYHPDSKERAKELEDSEVVDALGNEARAELDKDRWCFTAHGGGRVRDLRRMRHDDRPGSD